MCGRFTNRLTWREIVALYRLALPATPERNTPARYNICPTDAIDVVIERGGQVDLVPMRWGLIPLWWMKTAKEVPATFNARAETLAVKPMFRDAFRRNRCFAHSGRVLHCRMFRVEADINPLGGMIPYRM
jgi:putative SOS response-associated peptidase YedK